MNGSTQNAIAQALSSEVTGVQRLSGGDINDAYALTLADGRRVFAKENARADSAMFETEARGLEWLRAAEALTVPEVLAVAPKSASHSAFLVLELLDPAAKVRDFDERLGRGLAGLHRFGAASFGLDHDNFIGSLPQQNQPTESWAEFYRERRLSAQLSLAQSQGYADAQLRRDFERLFARLGDLVGPAEPPARLHGDLWGGNLHVDSAGLPALIDPAVYAGHREMDLAMMRLFGGFAGRVFEAYREAHPLSPGYEERVPLYQLYPLMVHLNLFGGGYLGQVKRALAHYV